MSPRARWEERATGSAGAGSGSPPAVERGAPVLRALGWSIAVVLVAGVLAVLSAPGRPASTVLRQAGGQALPVEQGGLEVLGVAPAPSGPAGTQAPVGGPEPVSGPAAASSAPLASAAATGAKPRAKVAAAPQATPPAPGPKAAPVAAAPRLQPAPGTYPLRIAGTSSVGGVSATVPTSGSLVVEARGADQQLRTLGVPGDLVLVQRSSASGIDLVSFSLTAGSTTLSFAPPSPLPFVRTQPGSWSWSVKSTDGAVTLSQTATVTNAGPVTIGGTSVPAVTVQRVFTVSGASVSGTVRLTSTVSLVDRLPLIQTQSINVTGKALGGLVSKLVKSESTATLTSTSPR